jgi:biopolymer transport protein TolR
VLAPGTAFDEKYVRVNVTNYASKPDYSFNLTTQSVEKVRGFLVKHDSLLRRADSIYGVPKEVIASLLWVESKHGVVLGKNHVASVYLSTLLASDSEFVDKNTTAVMTAQKIDSTKIDSVRAAIQKRAERKVKWDEVIAIIKERQSKNPEQAVVIAADKEVLYEKVVEVMNTLQRNNVQRVGLLVRSGN